MVKEIAEVVYQAEIATDIMSLLLKVTFARDAVPGQFVSLYSADGSRLLPRPISICETDASVEPPSTTMYSTSTPFCERALSIAVRIVDALL